MTPSEPSRSLSPVQLFAEAARDIAELRPKLECSSIYVQHVEEPMRMEEVSLKCSHIYNQQIEEPMTTNEPPSSLSTAYTIFEEQDFPGIKPKPKPEGMDTPARKSKSSHARDTRLYLDLTKEFSPWVRVNGTPKPEVEESICIINNTPGRIKYCLRCGRNDHELKNCTWFPSATLPRVKHIGSFQCGDEKSENGIVRCRT